MRREEVLSLLRQRTGRDDVVHLLDRRYPDLERPEELVPLAAGMMASTDLIAERIPELPEQCRDLIRLRLQGKSSEEIAEELDADPVEVYTRCRRRLFPKSKPLSGYSADAEENRELFARALIDQRTFDSVRDEQILLTLLEDPAARARLLAASEDVRFTIAGTLREWFERPRSKVLVALGLIGGLSILVQRCGTG